MNTIDKTYSMAFDGVEKATNYNYYIPEGQPSGSNLATNVGKVSLVSRVNIDNVTYNFCFDYIKVKPYTAPIPVLGMDENFNGKTITDLTKWTFSRPAVVSIDDDPDGTASDKVLKLSPDTADYSMTATTATFNPIKGNVIFEQKLRFTATDTAGYAPFLPIVRDSGGNEIMRLMVIDQNLYMHNGDATNIGTLTANNWITLKVELDTYSKKFDVWIGSSKVASGVNFKSNEASTGDVGKVEYTAVRGTTAYIDDLKISKVTNVSLDENFLIQVPYYGRTGNDVDVLRTIKNMYAQEKSVTLLVAEYTPEGILVNVNLDTKTILAGATDTLATKITNGVSNTQNFVKIFIFQDIDQMKPLCKIEYEKIVNLLGAYFVAMNGSDEYSGKYATVFTDANGVTDGPLKTLAKAQQIVRSDISGGMAQDETVYIREGEYFLM
jgi:hypothetical protein